MEALIRFCHIVAANTFTTKEIDPHTISALGLSFADYRRAALRYDLCKLRAEGLVRKPPRLNAAIS